MSYMNQAAFASAGGIQELTFAEIGLVDGGSTTSEVAAHVSAVAAIVAAVAVEVPPVSVAAGAVAVVAGLVSIWS